MLGLEYVQCQYSGGTEYTLHENLYRSVTEQIGAKDDIAAGRGKEKISPLTFRAMLKPHISIETKAERRLGMWEIHCMVKNIINGKANGEQIRSLEVHKFRRMELYND